MADHIVKEGDTGIDLISTLADENGAVNLAGWTVVFSMTLKGETALKVDGGACVVDGDQAANTGLVTYSWQPADVDTPGDYEGEFLGTNPLGKEVRFPRDEGLAAYKSIKIVPHKK